MLKFWKRKETIPEPTEEERKANEERRYQELLTPGEFPLESIVRPLMNHRIGVVVQLLYSQVYHQDRRIKELEKYLAEQKALLWLNKQ